MSCVFLARIFLEALGFFILKFDQFYLLNFDQVPKSRLDNVENILEIGHVFPILKEFYKQKNTGVLKCYVSINEMGMKVI